MRPSLRNTVVTLAALAVLATATTVAVTNDDEKPTAQVAAAATLPADYLRLFEPGSCPGNAGFQANGGSFTCTTERAYEGTGSMRLSVTSGDARYTRAVTYFTGNDSPPKLQTGDTLYAGAAYYMPKSVEDGGYTTIIRADDCCEGGTSQFVGIKSNSNTPRWQAFGGRYSGDIDLGQQFDLPEDQWFSVEYHVVLGAGGWVQVNGTQVTSWTSGSPTVLSRSRGGITSTGGVAVPNLWFDRFYTGRTRLGPIGNPNPDPPPPAAPVFKSEDGRRWNIPGATPAP